MTATRTFVRSLAVLACAAAVLSCDSPAAPTTGSASIAITGASVANGGTWVMGLGVDVSLTVTASDDLLQSSRMANPYVGAGRLPFYVCLSIDGVHFTSQCVSGLGLGNVEARVIGPTESFNIRETTHLIAFVIPAEDYGVPLTAFTRFGAGDVVPRSALAVQALPWVIHWEPRPVS
jgi:hypothetical protein